MPGSPRISTRSSRRARRRPDRDLISGIAQGRTEAGERLSRQEIASFIALMMVAGGETTDRGLANFIAVLLQHPDVLAAVRSDPALIDPAFSEFMRRDGVVVYEDRELRRDAEWYGTTIPAGRDRPRRAHLGQQRRDGLRRSAAVRPDASRPASRQGEPRRRAHRWRRQSPGVRAGQAFLHRLPAGPRGDRDGDPRARRAHARHALRRRARSRGCGSTGSTATSTTSSSRRRSGCSGAVVAAVAAGS